MDRPIMQLQLLRFSNNNDSTIGLLFHNKPEHNKFLCFTLEDAFREEKIYGKTRIPEGNYKIELRTEGGHHDRYLDRYPRFHVGMLELQDVPNFTHILIHIGNYIEDTEGCILVGETLKSNTTHFEGRLEDSALAYKFVYKYIVQAFDRDEDVWINIKDYEKEVII